MMAENFKEEDMDTGTIETDAAPVGHLQLGQIETAEEYITTCVEKIENLSTADEKNTSNAATPPTFVGLHHSQSYTDQAPIINQNSQESSIVFQNEDGDTCLHLYIISNKTGAALRIIPRAKAVNGLNIANCRGQTPLHLAVLTDHSDVVRHLVVYGAQVNVCDRHGNTALHLACREGKWSCVRALTSPIQDQLLLHRIPLDYNIRNYEGWSCLHLLVQHKPIEYIECINYLVTCGADINWEAGRSGRTILHLAAESNDVELTRFLINNPAVNLISTTWADETAYHLATGRGHHDIEKMFEEVDAATEPINHDDACDMDESQ